MARKASHELSGRPVSKGQIDDIVETLRQHFPSPSMREFSIGIGNNVYTESSLEKVTRSAGSPDIVRTFSIAAQNGKESFALEIHPDRIRMSADGEGYFADGLCGDVRRILDRRRSWASRHVPHRLRKSLRVALPLLAVADVSACLAWWQLGGWGWLVAGAQLAVVTGLLLWVAKSLSSYVLLDADARPPWSRTERIALFAAFVTLVGVVLGGVKMVRDQDSSPAAPAGHVTRGAGADPEEPAASHPSRGEPRHRLRLPGVCAPDAERSPGPGGR
ncbi:hypothetical protein GCM10010218_09880 [Streptomyces mashuensis]|uniref:Uncharacterized protein n=1 Tax=Streptomyces mashuensis TaxID=33904 RepID=A0A919AZ18_9ACTN|nr:hypothetical protein [Streptomyces mashuensis]GHF30608.1 hypothetical protein GCM10010218_09880 [Streptomyces mashuensis]